MKKHLTKILLAAFAVMLLSMSVLVGCGGGGSAESLEGTKWSITKVSAGGVDMDVAQYAKMAGVSTDNMYIEFKGGKAIANMAGTSSSADYTYENGKLVIDGQEVQVNGNTMSVESGGVSMTLQKQ